MQLCLSGVVLPNTANICALSLFIYIRSLIKSYFLVFFLKIGSIGK